MNDLENLAKILLVENRECMDQTFHILYNAHVFCMGMANCPLAVKIFFFSFQILILSILSLIPWQIVSVYVAVIKNIRLPLGHI